jgi:hypothetical protein
MVSVTQTIYCRVVDDGWVFEGSIHRLILAEFRRLIVIIKEIHETISLSMSIDPAEIQTWHLPNVLLV